MQQTSLGVSMHDLSANSIALYQANPMFQPLDFQHISFARMVEEIALYKTTKAVPETDALRFYLYNHAFHLVRGKYSALTTLPDDLALFAQTHIASTSAIAKRMLCHTVVSTICEMDYLGVQKADYYRMMTDSYGANVADFLHHVHETNRWQDFKNLDATCGQVAGALVSGFAFSDWAYRKPWTKITGLSRQCVFGEISLENFADQSFSLTHWGGSILNKCHLYECCTDTLYHLLDVQDSGQISQWIGQNLQSKYVSAELKNMHKLLSRHFPEEMNGTVNATLVKKSNAKREQYRQQINQWVQAAFNNGAGGRQPPSGERKPNAIDRANRTILGF